MGREHPPAWTIPITWMSPREASQKVLDNNAVGDNKSSSDSRSRTLSNWVLRLDDGCM